MPRCFTAQAFAEHAAPTASIDLPLEDGCLLPRRPLPHFRQLHIEAASRAGRVDYVVRGRCGDTSQHDCCTPGSISLGEDSGVYNNDTGSPLCSRDYRCSSSGSGGSGSGRIKRQLTVADYLVTDPLAEGRPALKFSGLVNAKAGLATAVSEAKPPWSGTRYTPITQDRPPSMASGRQPPWSTPAAPAGNTQDPYSETTADVLQETPQQTAAAAACDISGMTRSLGLADVSQSDKLSDGKSDRPLGRSEAPKTPLPKSKQSIPPAITAADGTTEMVSDRVSDKEHNPWAPYWVPDAELAARGAVLSIVGPGSPTTECFTKTYGSYSKACFPISSHTMGAIQFVPQASNCFSTCS